MHRALRPLDEPTQEEKEFTTKKKTPLTLSNDWRLLPLKKLQQPHNCSFFWQTTPCQASHRSF